MGHWITPIYAQSVFDTKTNVLQIEENPHDLFTGEHIQNGGTEQNFSQNTILASSCDQLHSGITCQSLATKYPGLTGREDPILTTSGSRGGGGPGTVDYGPSRRQSPPYRSRPGRGSQSETEASVSGAAQSGRRQGVSRLPKSADRKNSLTIGPALFSVHSTVV